MNIDEQINKLIEQKWEIDEKIEKLNFEKNKDKNDKVVKCRIFSEAMWQVERIPSIDSDSLSLCQFFGIITPIKTEDNKKEISKMINELHIAADASYHDEYYLEHDLKIVFSDGDIWLRFEHDIEDMIKKKETFNRLRELCKKYGICIFTAIQKQEVKNSERKLELRKKELQNAERFCEWLKGTDDEI